MIDKIRSDNVTVDMRRRFGGENIIALSNEQQINDNLIELPICAAATVSDINLNGSVTSLDGIDVTNALFVLVKNQTDKTENGIYIVNPSGWVRWEGLTVNMLCLVVGGDTQENTIWQNINTELDIDTTEIEFKLLEFGGGGLEFFEEARNTVFPNATKPVHILRPVGVATDIDVALVPKGNGAISIQIPDATVTNGNKRGHNAIDLQYTRTEANQVASGSGSIILGGFANRCTSSGGAIVSGSVNVCAGIRNAIVGSGASFIDGGQSNVIIGGSNNRIRATATESVIAAGFQSETYGWSTLTQGSNNIANDFCEVKLGLYATASSGNRSMVSPDNSIFKLGSGTSISDRKDAIKVLGDGRLFAETLKTPSTKKELLISDETGLIQNLSEGTTGQVLIQKALEPVWETLAIPENRASFLPVQDIFLNEFVTNDPAPYPDPITTYRLLGDILDIGTTPFKVSLTAGKRYAVKIRLIFDKTGTSGYHEFQLKIDGESSWNGFLQYQLTYSFVINPYDDISLDAGANTNRIRNIALNQEKTFYYENDSNLDYDILEIEGIVTTGTDDGELTISMRNIYRFDADDSNPCVVAQNSFIKAIECEAN